jgi:EAL domain-containing protein (putative c-di-GMP-specific phosphodiesterase class I)
MSGVYVNCFCLDYTNAQWSGLYASFQYLQKFPIHILKIDKGFVQNMLTKPIDRAIVKMAILLGHELGLEVIAEGVETKEQFEWIKNEGCDVIQGYYFSRPCLLKDIKIDMRNC